MKTNGIWKKYNLKSKYNILIKDIQKYNTGWYIASNNELPEKINDCEYYVYFDFNNVPRILLRTDKAGILCEVRGIDINQNIESEMLTILCDKIKEFPNKEYFYEKASNMLFLTMINLKHQLNDKLTKQELRFLYEIDKDILGFGLEKDARIKQIKKERNSRKDLACIFECDEKQIALTVSEALSGNIKYYSGNLYLLNNKTGRDLKLPEIVRGDLDLSNLVDTDGLIMPKFVGGNVDLSNLEKAENLQLPKIIKGHLDLNSLKSVDNIEFPEFVGKTINMPSVSHINELKLGDVVGSIFLDNLEDIEKLYVPVDFDLSKLKCKEETMHRIKKNVIFEDALSQSNNKCRIRAIN